MKLNYKIFRVVLLTTLFFTTLSSCAILKAGSYASDAFMREPDTQLAKEAFPTMMKAVEILYLTDTKNTSNAVMLASMYVMYANAFLDGEAFFIPDEDYEAKVSLLSRANALYIRAANILVPLVEAKVPGIFAMNHEKMLSSLGAFKKADVPLMYWTTASVLSAFAGNLTDFENASRISVVLALFNKACELDNTWNSGSLDEIGMVIYSSLPSDLGGNMDLALQAYKNANKINDGKNPGVFVSYAASICTAVSDKAEFEAALNTALKLPMRADKALMDTIAKRKAAKLLADIELYF